MEQKTFHHVTGSVKILSAVIGAGVVVAMGAITVASGADEPDTSTASSNQLQRASVTQTTAPSELATPFASPTYVAHPCAKRATMPC
jgi:hypothetical protein